MSKFLLVGLLIISVFYSGCTSKSMMVGDKRYIQKFGSNTWEEDKDYEKPIDKNTSKPEESVGYVAGQAAGAIVFTGAYILTLPIRVVEETGNALKTKETQKPNDTNSSE